MRSHLFTAVLCMPMSAIAWSNLRRAVPNSLNDNNGLLGDLFDDAILHWHRHRDDVDHNSSDDSIEELIEQIGSVVYHETKHREYDLRFQGHDVTEVLRYELDEAVMQNKDMDDVNVRDKAIQLYYATSFDYNDIYLQLKSRLDSVSIKNDETHGDSIPTTDSDQMESESKVPSDHKLEKQDVIKSNLLQNNACLRDVVSSLPAMHISDVESSCAPSTDCPGDLTPYTNDEVAVAPKPQQISMKEENEEYLEKPSPFSIDESKEEQFSSKQSRLAGTTKSLDSVEYEAYLDNELATIDDDIEENVDVAIVGAGIGGLCAGAILNTLYGKKVGIYESHYLAGGCAHAFERSIKLNNDKLTFTFDSGPTIVLGCSQPPYNPLRQVMNAIGLGESVEWIRYDGWGMIENPGNKDCLRWKLQVGADVFEEGPLKNFGGPTALDEWKRLKEITKPLVSGAVDIPAMAMRPGKLSVVPLLRYFDSLVGLISQGETVTGTFDPFMNGPLFTVTDQWLRDWLDALAFSLSGLPASRTPAAAMAYILFDMHRDGTALDYPRGGLGTVIKSLIEGVEQGDSKSRVNLKCHVQSINTNKSGSRAIGLTLSNGKVIKARDGVICNTPIWSLEKLLDKAGLERLKLDNRPTDKKDDLLQQCNNAEMTRSFLHLHLALDSTGLDLDLFEPHYTVMDKGLCNDPCGELNMIAVSNPCVIDRELAPEGFIIIHAYGAGNEPYEKWEGLKRNSKEYEVLKSKRAEVLWRAVESIIPDARERTVLSMIGSPLTHERFLRRPRGTYGAATEDLLKDGSTPIKDLVLCGDGIFPGIGVPAVAVNGASAANAMVGVIEQWKCMDRLKNENRLT